MVAGQVLAHVRLIKSRLVAASIDATVTAAMRGWHNFWFTPADPAPLGLLRILTGAMLLYSHAVWGLDLEGFLGPDGWNSAELIQRVQQDSWAFSFWWSVPPSCYLTVHTICLIVLTLFWLGCWTRLTSIAAFAIQVSYSNRAPLSDYGLDQIASILTLYLMIGPSGATYSIDRLFNRRRAVCDALLAGQTQIHFAPPRLPSAGLALRLIQVHYCVIYFFAGHSKLQGETWWTGEALWRAFANYEYQSTDMTWLAAYPWLLQLMTMVTLIFEVSFAYLIWNSRLRPAILCVGLALHFGIGAFMGMWTFGLMMMFGYIGFVKGETVRSFIKTLGSWLPGWPPMKVSIDPLPATIRTVAWMKACDMNQRIEIHLNSTLPDIRSGERIDHTKALAESESLALNTLATGGSHMTSDRPVVLCVNPGAEAGAVTTGYLNSRGYSAVWVATLGEAIDVVGARSVQAILCDGKSGSAADLEAFHLRWKESEISAVACYLLSRKQARELGSIIDSPGTAVVELPATLRDVRCRLQALLEDALVPQAQSRTPIQVLEAGAR